MLQDSKAQKIELALQEREFFEDLHFKWVTTLDNDPDVIPIETVQHMNILAGMMDRETAIIKRLQQK